MRVTIHSIVTRTQAGASDEACRQEAGKVPVGAFRAEDAGVILLYTIGHRVALQPII